MGPTTTSGIALRTDDVGDLRSLHCLAVSAGREARDRHDFPVEHGQSCTDIQEVIYVPSEYLRSFQGQKVPYAGRNGKVLRLQAQRELLSKAFRAVRIGATDHSRGLRGNLVDLLSRIGSRGQRQSPESDPIRFGASDHVPYVERELIAAGWPETRARQPISQGYRP
jgi:hypothetical protein